MENVRSKYGADTVRVRCRHDSDTFSTRYGVSLFSVISESVSELVSRGKCTVAICGTTSNG